ncbi:MAG: peptide deformylase [Verrucomicrobia bacterium]|nr:peptide deformylase [Verrucomicrobiota bacterium]MCF7707863.1 peptide deformylase [Verrucomicrobiota bacterium]
MVLPIVTYGNPVLRRKGGNVEEITPEIRRFISDLIESMKAGDGVGLAAQQVDRAIRIAVVDVREVEDLPSELSKDGEPVDIDSHMPMVLINPKITPIGNIVNGLEGCLSFPEIFGKIMRSESVELETMTENGETIRYKCGGFLARAVQHETDHLNGILFIDRMNADELEALRPAISLLKQRTEAALKS